MDGSLGEEGEGGTKGETHGNIYTTVFKIDSPWEFAVWLGELKPVLCDNLVGWDGLGWEVGGKFTSEGSCVTYG